MDIKSTATEQGAIVHPCTSDATDEMVESATTCPSCKFVGENEFSTCPSCGLIINKYFQRKLRRAGAATLSTSSEVDADEAGEITKSLKKALLVVCSLAITLLVVMSYRVSTHSTLSGPPANSTSSPFVSVPKGVATNAPLTNPPAATVANNPTNNLPPNPDAQAGARSQYAIEKQELDAATEIGTSAALDEFISKYPNSDWIDIATTDEIPQRSTRQKASGHVPHSRSSCGNTQRAGGQIRLAITAIMALVATDGLAGPDYTPLSGVSQIADSLFRAIPLMHNFLVGGLERGDEIPGTHAFLLQVFSVGSWSVCTAGTAA